MSASAYRLAVPAILPLGGRMVPLGILLQLLAGLMPVAFIVATSAIVGRVPGAVDAGLDSPEWRSLRNVLIVAGVLFVVQQLIGADAVHDAVHAGVGRRRPAARARSCGVVRPGRRRGASRIRDFDTLADLAYVEPRHRILPGLPRAGARCVSARDVPPVGGRGHPDRDRLRLVGGRCCSRPAR